MQFYVLVQYHDEKFLRTITIVLYRRNGSLKLHINPLNIFGSYPNYFINSNNEFSLSTFPILHTIDSFARPLSLQNSVTQNSCVVGSHFRRYQFLKLPLVYWLAPQPIRQNATDISPGLGTLSRLLHQTSQAGCQLFTLRLVRHELKIR